MQKEKEVYNNMLGYFFSFYCYMSSPWMAGTWAEFVMESWTQNSTPDRWSCQETDVVTSLN